MPPPPPAITAYHEAIQTPRVSFIDPELAAAEVARHPVMGTPLVSSGGFALTYKLTNKHSGNKWAVRVFKTYIVDRQERYAQISRYIEQEPADYFVPIKYFARGIRVEGNLQPITSMPWVEGETLSRYLTTRYQNSQVLVALADEFKRVIDDLERRKIAHGDLSHLNIVVRNTGHIVLVDYDGMYVPALAGRESAENGNASFQHPGRRSANFDATLDRFSAIVIYLALQAISRAPRLYNKDDAADQLLFSRTDFLQPDQSKVLRQISALPELRTLVDRFRQICRTAFSNVPTLSAFLSGQQLTLPISVAPAPPSQPQQLSKKAIDATDIRTLRANFGNVVTIVGRVIDSWSGVAHGSGARYLFLNFGFDRGNRFTLIYWPDGLRLAEAQRRNPLGYKNKWVRVTGLLQEYRGNPQIVYDEHVTVKVVPAAEAKQLIGLPSSRLQPNSAHSAAAPANRHITPGVFSPPPLPGPIGGPVRPVPPPPNTLTIKPGFSNPTNSSIRTPGIPSGAPSLPLSSQPSIFPPAQQPAQSLQPTGTTLPQISVTAPTPASLSQLSSVAPSSASVANSTGSPSGNVSGSSIAQPLGPAPSHTVSAQPVVSKPAPTATATHAGRRSPSLVLAGGTVFILITLMLALLIICFVLATVPAYLNSLSREPSFQTATESSGFIPSVTSAQVDAANSTSTLSPTTVPPTKTRRPSPTATPTVIRIVTRTTKNVNLRRGPGTTFAVVTILDPDTDVVVMERMQDGSWYHVAVLSSQTEGWLHSSTLDLSPQVLAVSTAAALPTMSGPVATPIGPNPFPSATIEPIALNTAVPQPGGLPGGAIVVACVPAGGVINVKNVQSWWVERFRGDNIRDAGNGDWGKYMPPGGRGIYWARDGSGPYVFCEGVDFWN
jgi:hypothetical protein